jgi:hypothetical protein
MNSPLEIREVRLRGLRPIGTEVRTLRRARGVLRVTSPSKP